MTKKSATQTTEKLPQNESKTPNKLTQTTEKLPQNELKTPNKLTQKIFLLISESQTYNILSLLVVILSISVIFFIGYTECQKCFDTVNNIKNVPKEKKIYFAYGHNIESGYLKSVFTVLERLGYDYDANTNNNWDLLWAHDYPFRTMYDQMKKLKPHQKVNHFPGCGYITNKVDLATSGLKYIPPAFKLPEHKEKLLEFSKKNPDIQFVQKNNNHRHIYIRPLSEIDLDKEGTFVQEFVDKPLLVNGQKFDIGIYTVITSIDPLRIYIYNGDALLRFCPVKYYPFDPLNIDKYVVGDDYTPPWDIPDIKQYYSQFGFSMKESLNAHLQALGKKPEVIWEQIEDSIRTVITNKEQDILAVLNRFSSKRNFFEMMRFDFVVNEDLKVYLMEANMSPNLSASHFPPNRNMFEQIIYNLFALVGIGERVQKGSLKIRSTAEEEMLGTDKNIAVFPNDCNSELCRNSCAPVKCQLCKTCLATDTKQYLLQAYKEHMNKGDFKRVYPPIMTPQMAKEDIDFEKFSAENQLMYRWYQGKCLMDPVWCN